jgi:PleD family two-component response regulator
MGMRLTVAAAAARRADEALYNAKHVGKHTVGLAS